MIEWQWLAPSIWELADQGLPFPWPKNRKAHASCLLSLHNILGNDELASIYPYEPKETANRNLRRWIAPILRGSGPHRQAALGLWIVRDWGGIKRGTDAIAAWATELADYSKERMALFIEARGNDRVSSWSKMLAFAEPDTQAIYDARTAVALNCILFGLGYRNGFHMPTGRNPNVEPVRKELRRLGMKGHFGYLEYLRLLNAIVATTVAEDILQVEMTLFANAPAIAERFSRELLLPRELESTDFLEVSVRDVRGDSFHYWVDQRLPPISHDYSAAMSRAIAFHMVTVGTAIEERQSGDPADRGDGPWFDAWVCEPFTRYGGEAIIVPTRFLTAE